MSGLARAPVSAEQRRKMFAALQAELIRSYGMAQAAGVDASELTRSVDARIARLRLAAGCGVKDVHDGGDDPIHFGGIPK